MSKMTGIDLDELLSALAHAGQVVADINKRNGWFAYNRSMSADIALLHSEVSEMFEAYRKNDFDNLCEEAADIFIRLLDTCYRHNINLAIEFDKKCQKNAVRPYRHGGKLV